MVHVTLCFFTVCSPSLRSMNAHFSARRCRKLSSPFLRTVSMSENATGCFCFSIATLQPRYRGRRSSLYLSRKTTYFRGKCIFAMAKNLDFYVFRHAVLSHSYGKRLLACYDSFLSSVPMPDSSV